jgi:hypothetical protein
MAENIRAGKGPTFPFPLPTDNFDPTDAARFVGRVPSTHFPPLYPAVLAVFRELGFSFNEAVRTIGPLAAAASVALFWLLARRVFRGERWASVLAVLASLFLFLVPRVWMYLLGSAMSESVFIPLMLAVLVALAWYVERPSMPAAVVAGVLCSLALLARDLGLTLAFTGVAVLLVFDHRHALRTRIRHTAAFLAVAASGPVCFTVWALVRSGGSTSRSIAWHPQPGAADFIPIFIGRMFGGPLPQPLNGILALVLLVGVPVLLYLWPPRLLGSRGGNRTLLLMLMVFVVTYVASLEVSRALFDASTPMDARLLGPVAAPLYLVVVATGWRLLSTVARRSWVPALVAGAVFVSVGSATIPTFDADRQYANYQGALAHDVAVAGHPLVDKAPDDAVLFTTDPVGIWAAREHPGIALPQPVILTEDADNTRYDEQMCQVAEVGSSRPTYVYLVDTYLRSYLPVQQELRAVADLDLVAVDDRTILYRITGPALHSPCRSS